MHICSVRIKIPNGVKATLDIVFFSAGNKTPLICGFDFPVTNISLLIFLLLMLLNDEDGCKGHNNRVTMEDRMIPECACHDAAHANWAD